MCPASLDAAAAALRGAALGGGDLCLALEDLLPEFRGGSGEAGAEVGGAHARRLLGPVGEARDDRLVAGLLGSLGGGLLVRERDAPRSGSASSAKKSFSNPRSRYSVRAGHGFGEPLGQLLAPCRGDRVVAAPAAGLLARLLEQAASARRVGSA